jgi:hypothetical protein
MTSYAKIENDIVTNLIVCADSDIHTQAGYHVKVTNVTGEAVIGGSYDSVNNKFISPKPYPSWIFNEESFSWEAPIANPSNSTLWNEAEQSWIIPE